MELPRLSEKEAVLIRLLLNNPGVQAPTLVTLSNGSLKRGTVYTTVRRLGQKGLIAVILEDSPSPGTPKRFYRVTELGKRIYLGLEEVARTVHG